MRIFLCLCSVKRSIADETGLKHVLLCRVILGKAELVPPGSEQCRPSSEDFDSGVDDLSFPKKYIVWEIHINTRILPEYVISFRAPPSSCLEGKAKSYFYLAGNLVSFFFYAVFLICFVFV